LRNDIFSDFFAQPHGQFTTLIVLATSDKVREFISFFCMKTFKQGFSLSNPKASGCCRKGDDLQIGKLRDCAAMGAVSVLGNMISGKFLEFVEYFTEFYEEVVHMRDDNNQELNCR